MNLRVWSRSKTLPIEEWGSKEVIKFLKRHDLQPYASAAKKAKIRGSHLVLAASTSTSASNSGEAVRLLCEDLGLTSPTDQRLLLLALLQLRRSLAPEAVPSLALEPTQHATSASSRPQSLYASAPCSPSSSSSTVATTRSYSEAGRHSARSATGNSHSVSLLALPSVRPRSPSTQSAPAGHTTPDMGITLRSTASPRQQQQQQHTAQADRYRHLRDTCISLAYVELFGVIAIKCVLRHRRSSGSSSSSSLSCSADGEDETDEERSRDEEESGDDEAEPEDVSLLLLDAHKPLLYADLVSEIKRVYGPQLAVVEGAGEVKVKVRYEDKEGDVVSVQSDRCLRYAHEDWLRRVRDEPKLSWRLQVDIMGVPGKQAASAQ
jgi:hypothetical protein